MLFTVSLSSLDQKVGSIGGPMYMCACLRHLPLSLQSSRLSRFPPFSLPLLSFRSSSLSVQAVARSLDPYLRLNR